MPSLMTACVFALGEALAPIGWTRASMRRDVFRSAPTGSLAWQLAANGTAEKRTGAVSFLPALGVRHPEAVDLEAAFLGLPKESSQFAASIGCGLIQLLPRDGRKVSERWRVSDEGEVERVMGVISKDFSLYGLPYYQEFDSIDSLISNLMERSRSQDQDGKLAILNALSDRPANALAALADYVEVARRQSPPISDQSWRFVHAFVEHFGIGESLLGN